MLPSLTLEQWGIVVAIISGLSGLGLSLYQLRESRKDKLAKVSRGKSKHVTMDLISHVYTNDPVYYVEVINNGQVPVIIAGWCIEGNGRTTLEETEIERESKELKPGSNTLFDADYHETLKELGMQETDTKASIRAVVRLAVGKKFHSKNLRLTQNS